MKNLRIYTSYPDGVNDHKGLVEHILDVTIQNNNGCDYFDYGLVIYDKVSDKVAFIDAQTLSNALPV